MDLKIFMESINKGNKWVIIHFKLPLLTYLYPEMLSMTLSTPF